MLECDALSYPKKKKNILKQNTINDYWKLRIFSYFASFCRLKIIFPKRHDICGVVFGIVIYETLCFDVAQGRMIWGTQWDSNSLM